jgi:HKD family nuclease
MFNRVIATLFIAAICLISAVSQDVKDDKESAGSGSKVEVKTDRFSNITTVNLKPQTILDKPDHLITMRVEAKIEKKAFDDVFRDSVDAQVFFESHTKTAVDFGDRQIRFLVDGQPLDVPPGEIEYNSLISKPKSGFKIYESGITIFNRAALERFKKADRIEMRIGSIELTLSTSMLATLREYATQTLAQQKAINGR